MDVKRLKKLCYKVRSSYTNIPISSLLTTIWENASYQTSESWINFDYLVVDLEFSSLNAQHGQILSIGWVCIQQGKIDLSSAEYYLVKADNCVGESATIHHLRNCDLTSGHNMIQLMKRFLKTASKKILVFHHANLDLSYLNQICEKHFGAPLLMPVVDTMLLEQKKWMSQNNFIQPNTLKLDSCRKRYGLHRHRAHNALEDALATAELLLAHIQHKGKHISLADLLS